MGPNLFPEQAFLGDEVAGVSPNGAGFDSPGRVSPGLRRRKNQKAPQGRDSRVGWDGSFALESRPIRGCRSESRNKLGIRFDDPIVGVLHTHGTSCQLVRFGVSPRGSSGTPLLFPGFTTEKGASRFSFAVVETSDAGTSATDGRALTARRQATA